MKKSSFSVSWNPNDCLMLSGKSYLHIIHRFCHCHRLTCETKCLFLGGNSVKPDKMAHFSHRFGSSTCIMELSGGVLDSRSRGCRFEPDRQHCVVSLSKTHKSLLSTGSTLEDPSLNNWKIVDWDVKNQIKQTTCILRYSMVFCFQFAVLPCNAANKDKPFWRMLLLEVLFYFFLGCLQLCHLLITFANNLDTDWNWRTVWSRSKLDGRASSKERVKMVDLFIKHNIFTHCICSFMSCYIQNHCHYTIILFFEPKWKSLNTIARCNKKYFITLSSFFLSVQNKLHPVVLAYSIFFLPLSRRTWIYQFMKTL